MASAVIDSGRTLSRAANALLCLGALACSVPRHVELAPAHPDTFVCTVLAADSLGFMLYEADSARATFAALRETPGQNAVVERLVHDLIDVRVRATDSVPVLRVRVWSAAFWRRMVMVSAGGRPIAVGTIEADEKQATPEGIRAAQQIVEKCSGARPSIGGGLPPNPGFLPAGAFVLKELVH